MLHPCIGYEAQSSQGEAHFVWDRQDRLGIGLQVFFFLQCGLLSVCSLSHCSCSSCPLQEEIYYTVSYTVYYVTSMTSDIVSILCTVYIMYIIL